MKPKVWEERFPVCVKNTLSKREKNTQQATGNAAETLRSRFLLLKSFALKSFIREILLFGETSTSSWENYLFSLGSVQYFALCFLKFKNKTVHFLLVLFFFAIWYDNKSRVTVYLRNVVCFAFPVTSHKKMYMYWFLFINR